jgi:hypothetical protein
MELAKNMNFVRNVYYNDVTYPELSQNKMGMNYSAKSTQNNGMRSMSKKKNKKPPSSFVYMMTSTWYKLSLHNNAVVITV